MARIRTIKPEFPQSESMGRVSRDARLLFVELWTICDDSGITRAASRMLASLLFPYDNDAPSLIDGWLCELEEQGCIVRYQVDGASYIKVQKWAEHQRIDKPSPSKFPQFVEASRTFPEASRKIVQDQGPRTKEGTKDQGEDSATQTENIPSIAKPVSSSTPLDLKKELFSRGVAYLTNSGLEDQKARSMLGKWRKEYGDTAVVMAMAGAEGAAVSAPIPYIQAVLKGKTDGRQPGNGSHPLGFFAGLADKFREAEASDGGTDYPSATQ